LVDVDAVLPSPFEPWNVAAFGALPTGNEEANSMRVLRYLRPLAAGVLLSAGCAFAQTTAPTATPSGQNLSEKLNQSNGVIQPKEVDPAIAKPAPKTADPNVVPPPQPKGAPPAAQPK
jgi:hypothetical protein